MTRHARRRTRSAPRALARFLIALAFAAVPAAAHEGHDGDAARAMVVAALSPGGPAAAAGLVEGDRIVSWNGERLRTQGDVDAFLGARQAGDVVRLEVDRDGGTIAVDLTLGDRGDGTPRLGISLTLEAPNPTTPAARDQVTRDECRTWLAATYRVAALAGELGLDLGEEIERSAECVDDNLAHMAPSIPRGWCDNVFKVHCSAVDLLAEIADSLIDRCAAELSESLGFDVARDRVWNACGEQRVADAYAMAGTVSDAAACRRILVDECGGGTGGE